MRVFYFDACLLFALRCLSEFHSRKTGPPDCRQTGAREERRICNYVFSFAFISASMRLLMLALSEFDTMESVFELNMKRPSILTVTTGNG